MAFPTCVVHLVILLTLSDGEETVLQVAPSLPRITGSKPAENASDQKGLLSDLQSIDPKNMKTQDHLNWSTKQSMLPAVSQTLGRPLSHCQLHLVTWSNFSQGSLIIPSSFGVEQMLQSTFRNRRTVSFNKRLQSVTGQSMRLTKPATHDCYLLFLYSLDCRFSYAAFPYIRALARAYPQFRFYAVRIEDYMAHRWSLRMLFVPKLKLIVDGRVLREYSGSDTHLDELVDFVWTNTRQLPKGPVTLLPEDLAEYPPEPLPKTDWCLIASWMTVFLSMLYVTWIHWDTFMRMLADVIYRLSGGRFGHAQTPSVQAGPILGWVPGQISSVH
ncbi:hypothetical protein D915_009064 [Fasciola hepatica]|uniref:Thioredoxin domain-containing protein n=1 Tax=Fasciola hepatica TaxID=6192 RepID=A0A4E0R0E1_FASHE|nr:hypothetical protein D915_009064 [Fasciola hepatica]